jgi:ADP-ribosylglycohydrolase
MERPLIRRNTIALKMEDFADEYDKGTGQMLYEAMVSEQRSAEEVLDKWRGWVADEAVAAALWCFLNTNNLRDALLLAANSPGDSDSIACMTGALAGAYYGVNQMPVVWLQCVEKTGELEVLAHRVVEALQGRV